MAAPISTAYDAPPAASPKRARPAWAFAIVIVAVIAVVIAFVVGIVGLTGNPVKSVAANGTTTLQGTFQPYQCNATSCDGYVQAGGRSVFVQFPHGCQPPARASEITVTARPAPDLGKASYRAIGCA